MYARHTHHSRTELALRVQQDYTITRGHEQCVAEIYLQGRKERYCKC